MKIGVALIEIRGMLIKRRAVLSIIRETPMKMAKTLQKIRETPAVKREALLKRMKVLIKI